jgi:hypothetical protein
MEPARTLEEYQAQLALIRVGANKRRAEAWAMVPESVLGIQLTPITPAIHSLLVGTGNAYFCGRIPTEGDLRNFIWFCSPQFNPDRPIVSLRWKWLQMHRLKMALRRGTKWGMRHEVVNNFYRACLGIHGIIHTTFRDGLPHVESDEPTQPLAASLEAQLVDMFAREYKQWPMPLPVRHTPIKQLYQLARCIDRRHLGKGAKYYDSDENTCTKRFLETINSRN